MKLHQLHQKLSITIVSQNEDHKPESNASKWLKEECICVQESDWMIKMIWNIRIYKYFLNEINDKIVNK